MVEILECQKNLLPNPCSTERHYDLVLEVLNNLLDIKETDLTTNEQRLIKDAINDWSKE